MKKLAYILGYTGAIGALIISIIDILVSYSYYSGYPTDIAQKSLMVKGIMILLNIFIIVLLFRMNFNKVSSSITLFVITIIALLLPGISKFYLRAYYFPQIKEFSKRYLYENIIYGIGDEFLLILVILACIIFLCSREKRINIWKK